MDDAALDEDDALDFDRDQARALLEGVLEARLGEECDRGRSLVGPHADKISFALSGKDVSSFASQGQQRSVVLACKVAEVNLIRETTGQNPILLLDDVMSELDEHRRAALVSFVENDIQTFITTTNVDYLDSSLMARAQTIHLPFATAGEEPSADGAKGDVR